MWKDYSIPLRWVSSNCPLFSMMISPMGSCKSVAINRGVKDSYLGDWMKHGEENKKKRRMRRLLYTRWNSQVKDGWWKDELQWYREGDRAIKTLTISMVQISSLSRFLLFYVLFNYCTTKLTQLQKKYSKIKKKKKKHLLCEPGNSGNGGCVSNHNIIRLYLTRHRRPHPHKPHHRQKALSAVFLIQELTDAYDWLVSLWLTREKMSMSLPLYINSKF